MCIRDSVQLAQAVELLGLFINRDHDLAASVQNKPRPRTGPILITAISEIPQPARSVAHGALIVPIAANLACGRDVTKCSRQLMEAALSHDGDLTMSWIATLMTQISMKPAGAGSPYQALTAAGAYGPLSSA
jgi:hypothetical protein